MADINFPFVSRTATIATTADVATAQAAAATDATAKANAAAATAAIPTGVEVRMIGTRIAQLVETRPDGTKNTWTFNYSSDVLTSITQNNPAKTLTFTNGWVVT